MSIIHDALKRVQQGLNPKADETPVTPPSETTPKSGATSLFAAPPPSEETVTMPDEHITEKKSTLPNTIKSILAFFCALAITAGSAWYLYQQFRNDIPQAQRLAKKSFDKLIHKEELPDFKTKRPEDLKPLARLTINTSNASSAANGTAPVTLDIHGIMSNASGNLVLINDQVYQEGDEVDGAKIVKINLNSISVLINGTPKTIYVKN